MLGSSFPSVGLNPHPNPWDLCVAFQNQAQSTWCLLQTAAKQRIVSANVRKGKIAYKRVPLSIGEETITDLHLLNFAALNDPGIEIVSFTKPAEKRTGADWQWWFGSSGRWIGVRVQAKVISLPSRRFKQLNHRAGKQCADLINGASTHSSGTRKAPNSQSH